MPNVVTLAREAEPRIGLGQWHNPWFDADPDPKFALSPSATLLHANRSAQALVDKGTVCVSRGSLRFGCAESNERVREAAGRTATGTGRKVRIIVRDLDGAWCPAYLHGVPGEGVVVLTLRAADLDGETGFDALVRQFALSHAEKQVLGRLVDGDCPKEAARQLSVSEHTIRTHLRAIYAKLGVRGMQGALRFTMQMIG